MRFSFSLSLFFSGANIFQIARNFSAIALIVRVTIQHLIQHSADPMNNSLNFSLSLFYYFPLLSAGKSTHTDRAAEMHTRRVGELKKKLRKKKIVGLALLKVNIYVIYTLFFPSHFSLTRYSFLLLIKKYCRLYISREAGLTLFCGSEESSSSSESNRVEISLFVAFKKYLPDERDSDEFFRQFPGFSLAREPMGSTDLMHFSLWPAIRYHQK